MQYVTDTFHSGIIGSIPNGYNLEMKRIDEKKFSTILFDQTTIRAFYDPALAYLISYTFRTPISLETKEVRLLRGDIFYIVILANVPRLTHSDPHLEYHTIPTLPPLEYYCAQFVKEVF